MSKKTIWIGGFIVFLVLAGVVAAAARDLLPKVTTETITVKSCSFSTDRLEMDKGQTLKLTLEADRDGTFTIDSYNISEAITANQPKDISFKTVRSGAYDAKLSGCEEHVTLLVKDDDGNLPSVEEHHSDDEEGHDEGTEARESDEDEHDEGDEAHGE